MTGRPPPLMIRGVDPDLWRAVRVEALKRKQAAGELLNEVLREWLKRARSGVSGPETP